MIYTNLMKILSKSCENKLTIIVYYKNGLVFESLSNTGVYESMNEYEMDDPNFIEYYAYAVQIPKILQNPTTNEPPVGDWIKNDKFLEISELNEPVKITLLDGTILWEKILI